MPRLLDLFCGAGGAAVGYHRAGFEVVGVDIEPQPHYPFDFFQADALEAIVGEPLLGHGVSDFDAIHASPPCQAFTNARVIHGNEHPDLLTPTRPLLEATGLPCVIENVPGAPMRRDFNLCGTQFGLRSDNGKLIRHRWFECVNWSAPFAFQHPCNHSGTTISVFGHGGHVYYGVEDWREVMGIDWMTRDELAQAIPPTFAEHVGGYLMAEIHQRERQAA